MKAGKVGIASAVLASACCVGPIVLVLLGLGGSVLGAFLAEYHWHLQIGAVVVLALAWWIFLHERKRLCTIASDRKGEKVTKTTLGIVSIIVAVFVGMNLVTALQSEASDQKANAPILQNAASVVIPVSGMTCMACEVSVNSALKKLPGVLDANADSRAGQVTVKYDPLKVSIQQMADAITKAGYKPAVKSPTP